MGGFPAFLRMDNGPEFVSNALADWCRFNGASTVFIEPGSPWQNARIESFNGRVRDELLNGEVFSSLLEAQVVIEDWRNDYNTHRPHSALKMQTPAACARTQAARWATDTTAPPAPRPADAAA
jgi:putative transposase